MVYEIDRFDLPKSPSLNEIQEKEIFMSLAAEMGWQEITHDEDMNYYFGKEYVDGDINELYTDEEMRRIHADKYRQRYYKIANQMSMWGMVLGIALIAEIILFTNYAELLWAVLILMLYFAVFGSCMNKAGTMYYKELQMEIGEWHDFYEKKKNMKKCYRFFFTTKGLERFLKKQSERGLHIVKMTDFSFLFEKGIPVQKEYTLDTRAAVNSRRKNEKTQKIKDGKDLNNINQDWQIQSVKDAQEKGMQFICSCGNGQILYCGENGNTIKSKNRLLHTVFLGVLLGLFFCFAAGFAVGFLAAWLT